MLMLLAADAATPLICRCLIRHAATLFLRFTPVFAADICWRQRFFAATPLAIFTDSFRC